MDEVGSANTPRRTGQELDAATPLELVPRPGGYMPLCLEEHTFV